jgi:hypothetical protein
MEVVMNRLIVAVLVAALGLSMIPQEADAARARVVKRGHRTTVVVHRGFPLRRTMHTVVVRPARVAVRVRPALFLAPVIWAPVVITRPAAADLVWEDAENLTRDEDWTEFTLNADSRGRKLAMHVTGTVQIDFAEVVFDNGEARVVDFANKTRSAGTYQVLDFADGRKVDHVRMVARARTGEARIGLWMVK